MTWWRECKGEKKVQLNAEFEKHKLNKRISHLFKFYVLKSRVCFLFHSSLPPICTRYFDGALLLLWWSEKKLSSGERTQAARPINVTLWKWTEIEKFMCMVLVSILMSTWTLKGFPTSSCLYFSIHFCEIKICDDKAQSRSVLSACLRSLALFNSTSEFIWWKIKYLMA